MPRVPILMPQLGESIAEATIVRLDISPGDQVSADDEIIEVETQKASMEITTSFNGTVAEISAVVGESYPVGATLGFLEVSDEEAQRVGIDAGPAAQAAVVLPGVLVGAGALPSPQRAPGRPWRRLSAPTRPGPTPRGVGTPTSGITWATC